ncbi:MAG: pyridoxamine 5'-phosphate oxidase [Nocardioidaceae bacterium]|nr:pyridoxamine 5'-phosphate oxidase [Nocardioidaceae bacterium]
MTSELSRDIASWRREYSDQGLSEADLADNPISAFVEWLSAARAVGLHEPNALVVSTVNPEGAPSSRMVLLKTVDARGFVFYTNFDSRKGRELLANPACALLFPWHPLERQVRVEGVAARVNEVEADAYFAARPRGSQLGAWASPQSEVVADIDFLRERYATESDRFAGSDVIPRPPQWSGFLVRPHLMEFWQGRPGRMHDRIQFSRLGDDNWHKERLAP